MALNKSWKEDDEENGSDYCDHVVDSDALQKTITKLFAVEGGQPGLDELRQKISEAAKIAVYSAMHGDELEDLQKEVHEKEQQIEKLKQDKKLIQAEIDKRDIEDDDLQKKLIGKETEIKKLQSKVKSLKRQITLKEKEISNNAAEISEEDKRYEKEIMELKKINMQLKEDLKNQNEGENDATKEVAKLREDNANLKERLINLKRKSKK